MKTKLSPFVYLVKGSKNHLLYDSLKGKTFSIPSEGNPAEVEKQLIENKLVIETEGIVPFKFQPDIQRYKNNLILREIQIRITGSCHRHCTNCGEIGKCKKDHTNLNRDLIDLLADQLTRFQIETLVITGGNPLLEIEKINHIRSIISALCYKILLVSSPRDEFLKEKEIVSEKGFVLSHSICHNENINQADMTMNVTRFFYHQQFNPCWGNKLAIDTNGDIKPCLWSDHILGNITNTHPANIVLTKQCDPFWELTKDKINGCRQCEFRYFCQDCRVRSERDRGQLDNKPSICSYIQA
ncbi:MAG: SPASM domain-containing protein [Candidatus Omnitrophota bacterium]